jgi:hypothetical protein
VIAAAAITPAMIPDRQWDAPASIDASPATAA